ncbi:LysM peptidoglycan-binding domain-containing protein [Sphingomonas sp.]|uniref:LysM peptidoglycan-binding domain-containing protein n=1 Tax=Sphingomonas sp. TaxID=28214 RepID=UPI002FDABC27
MPEISRVGAIPGHRSSPPEGGNEHVVRRGDSLWSIARHYGVSLAQLERANPQLASHDFILPGDRVRIPNQGGASHVVRAGETISEIASEHGISPQAIVDANGLKRPDLIHPGDRLTLPAPRPVPHATRAPAAPAPSATRTAPATPQQPASDVRTMFDPALGSRARGAVIIGQAEGTRTPSGGFRDAYHGHIDPGNGVGNRGSFSLQHAGNLTPEQADAQQLARLSRQIPAFETAARAAGLDPNNATLATGYLDLYNQSPTAAARFLDQIGTLRETGVTRQSVTDLRIHAYIDRTTGERFPLPGGGRAGSGFVNIAQKALGRIPTEAEVQRTLRADQSRRMQAMDAAITAGGATTAATPRPATPGGPARFTSSPGIDLTPAATRSANALHDSVQAATGFSIHVTSGRRGPDRQASAMYNNFADNSSPRYANQAAFNEVRDAYLSGKRAGLGRAAIVDRMANVLQRQADRGVLISRHMSDRALDIRMPPAANRQAVVAAMRDNPAVQSVGIEDDHLHVQLR